MSRFSLADYEEIAMSTAAIHPTSSKVVQIARWSLQGVVAAAFLAAAAAKLAGAPPMVAIFEQIGIGQWFRYVTAVVEITGAVLLVWPGRSGFGAALLACTMAVALLTHLTLIGGNWGPAAGLFLLNLLILWLSRDQIGTGLGRRPA